jgi:hypothetical protein
MELVALNMVVVVEELPRLAWLTPDGADGSVNGGGLELEQRRSKLVDGDWDQLMMCTGEVYDERSRGRRCDRHATEFIGRNGRPQLQKLVLRGPDIA